MVLACCSHRGKDRDIPLLLEHHHYQCRYDVEGSHEYDQSYREEQREFFELECGE